MSADHRTVTDIHGEQILVGEQWYHAERVFGRPAASFRVGDVVEGLSPALPRKEHRGPADAHLDPDLVRGCSSNTMDLRKVDHYLQVMVEHEGWGPFPPASGYVGTVDADLVEESTVLGPQIWCSERGWARQLRADDIGKAYVHITEGHHRCAAAIRAGEFGIVVRVPVYDLNLSEQEDQPARPTARG